MSNFMVTVTQYEEIIAGFSPVRKNILITHYLNAPFYDTTEIAKVLKYPNINSVNMQIGTMGKLVSEKAGIIPEGTYERKGEERIPYFRLIHEDLEYGWELVENLQIAMENLGWLDEYEKDHNTINLEFETSRLVDKLYREGKLVPVYVNKYERDRSLRDACLSEKKDKCLGCEINFKEAYGEDIPNIIHVHHIRPLGQIKAEEYKNPVVDLIPLCPNCHAVVHATKELMSLDQLRSRLKQNRI